MSERQEGWYWVQGMDGCPWECSYWAGDGWDDNEAHEYEPTTVGPRIPTPDEPFAVVPEKITAESGHKAGMIGDFSVTVLLRCEECDGCGDDENDDTGVCSGCGGAGEYAQAMPITWPTLKDIHDRIVEIAAAPKP